MNHRPETRERRRASDAGTEPNDRAAYELERTIKERLLILPTSPLA
jgi:hypothetical protein